MYLYMDEYMKIILSTSVGVALIATLQTILASRIACDSYRYTFIYMMYEYVYICIYIYVFIYGCIYVYVYMIALIAYITDYISI
jgi:hypothetical protein